MTRELIVVLAVALAAGLGAGSAWGRLAGVGVFAAVALVGAMVLVLRRNQRDLQQMESGLPPGEVGDAIREPPLFDPTRRPPRD